MFSCSLCGAVFNDSHAEYECKDILQEHIFNMTLNLDRYKLVKIYHFICELHKK